MVGSGCFGRIRLFWSDPVVLVGSSCFDQDPVVLFCFLLISIDQSISINISFILINFFFEKEPILGCFSRLRSGFFLSTVDPGQIQPDPQPCG